MKFLKKIGVMRMAAPHGGARQMDVKSAVDVINRQRRELEDQFRRKRTLVLRVINARAAAEAVRSAAEEKARAAAERERDAGRERAARHEQRVLTGLRELRQVCASAEEVAALTGMGVGHVRAVLAAGSPPAAADGFAVPETPGLASDRSLLSDAAGFAASDDEVEAAPEHGDAAAW